MSEKIPICLTKKRSFLYSEASYLCKIFDFATNLVPYKKRTFLYALHNSDLFLNSEFTDSNKKELDTDNFKSDISKKRPNFDENNFAKLQISLSPPTVNKTVVSYLNFVLQKNVVFCIAKLRTGTSLTQSDSGKYEIGMGMGQNTLPRYELRSGLLTKRSLPLPSQRFGIRLDNEFQVTLKNNTRSESRVLEKTEHLTSDKRSSNKLNVVDTPQPVNNVEAKLEQKSMQELRCLTKNYVFLCNKATNFVVGAKLLTGTLKRSFLPLQNLRFCNELRSLQKRNFFVRVADENHLQRPALQQSFVQTRKLMLVTVNLILFSVLTVVQRSNHSKNSSPFIEKGLHAVLCESKIPVVQNKSSWQYLNQIRPGQKHKVLTEQNQKQERFVGIFLGEPSQCVEVGERPLQIVPICNELSSLPNLRFGIGEKRSFDNEVCCQIEDLAKVRSFAVQKNAVFCKTTKFLTKKELFYTPCDTTVQTSVDCVIKPWYWIKSCHTLNNTVVATRSAQQVFSPININPVFHYIPYYTNQERIFAESDTIPSKRETIFSQTAILNTSDQLNSSIAASEYVLKRCFYKYGFVMTSPALPERHCQSETSYLCQLFDLATNLVPYKKVPFLYALLETSTAMKKNMVMPTLRFGNERNKKDPFLLELCSDKVKSSLTPSNFAFYKNVETSSLKPSFSIERYPNCLGVRTKKKPLCKERSSLPNIRFGKGKKLCFDKPFFVRTVFQPVVNTVDNFIKSRVNHRSFINKFCYAWSKHNLSQRFHTFVQVKGAIPTFHFIPDGFVRNTSVSGYQFPELQNREIVYLFRRTAILHFYSEDESKNKKFSDRRTSSFWQKLFTQLRTSFRMTRCDLISRTLPTEESKFSSIPNLRFDSELNFDTKMQYTQLSLDEEENVKYVFSKLGRDYQDYLRQPKDSLPALIISPSLEEDREIEEEGIRIFRKRDLVKSQNTKHEISGQFEEKALYNNQLAEHPSILEDMPELGSLPNQRFGKGKKLRFDGESNTDNTSFLKTQELAEKKSKPESKNDIQNHQNLVKNALRQAQEEIDSIAKKEEKGGEKDKQVIPPLTRLEALYTIRNRERKHEQAKNFVPSKKITSSLRSRRGTKSFFEELFLYSDKPNIVDLRGTDQVDGHKMPVPGTKKICFLLEQGFGVKFLPNLQFGNKQSFNKKFRFDSEVPIRSFVVQNVVFCKTTTRKHSFFGEMSLLAKKLTAQEQKQIFEQKANPLVPERSCISEPSYHCKIEDFATSFVSYKKVPFFYALPNRIFGIGKKLRFDKAPDQQKLGNRNTEFPKFQTRTLLANPFATLPSPIYFYNTVSQNKACQSSAPKVKGTPLGSPVSHRVWQPKRMETSTFRVSPRSQSTHVVPQISQQDWKNIIQWQLNKYFFEEDKRLLPIVNKNDVFVRTHQNLKIKKINLYLPWVSIKKGDIVNKQGRNQAFHPCQIFDLATPVPGNKSLGELRFDNEVPCDGSSLYPISQFLNKKTQNGKETNYWRLPIQKGIYTVSRPLEQSSRQQRKTNNDVKPSSLQTVNDVKARLKPKQKFCLTKKRSFLYSEAWSLPNLRFGNELRIPKKELGIGKKFFNESILFESVTRHSWLFIYTFVFVLMFKQLFNLVYKIGLKDFFIKFLNSDFGRTVTSEERRYSLQNLPLTESYMPNKRLQQLLGVERNKVQLLEIVWFLRNNCQGRHGPRGVLLVGPPGVESVSVVQAIAGEARVPVIVQSLEKIAQDNEPQRQLEQLYMRAHKQAPCVLFLDRLDTIGARRDQLLTNKAHTYKDFSTSLFHPKNDNAHIEKGRTKQQTVDSQIEDLAKVKSFASSNQLNVVLRLLTILDGMTQSSGVVTVATAQDLTPLDPALLRPKRFDRRIYLSLPNRQDRVHLFKTETRSIGHIKEMPWNYLSLQTENMSVPDIKSAINYSLFRAVIKNSVHTVETLEYGIDCVKSLTGVHA